MRGFRHRSRFVFILFVSSVLFGFASAELPAGLEPEEVPSGFLYDHPVPLSGIAAFDGRPDAPLLDGPGWRQIYFEMRGAAVDEAALPALETLREGAKIERGGIPLALIDLRYHRFRDSAWEDGTLEGANGSLVVRGEDPLVEGRVFAATALKGYTYRGSEVRFLLREDRFFMNEGRRTPSLEIDLGDGGGFRTLVPGRAVVARYEREGRKRIRVRAYEEERILESEFPFMVRALVAPLPNDTLQVTATESYLGSAGTGEAYVYLSPSHTELTDPVVVIEGFDLDDTMNWDELYALLNQQGLVETLRAEGFDAVVLNFDQATDYIQRNAFVIEALVEQVGAVIDPGREFVLIGASMGGLASRYALAWMESMGIDHRVRSYISFDAPQNGANIPLGVQHWVSFFSGLSADAEFLLSRLDTPAARQMLVYHHASSPGPAAGSDPLRATFEADLDSVGSWPAALRKVSVANGSGFGMNQGFTAGTQIVEYDYDGLLIDIRGNVWAVPEGVSTTVFDGRIRIWPLPEDLMQVTVSGTAPYDNAPGGSRASMADMDATEAPYGDIIALHPSHCFIPTVSALALGTTDLFYDIAGDPNLLSMTPFDAVYYPTENQEHVLISGESAEWFLGEIRLVSTEVAAVSETAPRLTLLPSRPNPFNPATTIRFDLPSAGPVSLRLFDASGREVANLVDAPLPTGRHEIRFDGSGLASGVYFTRLHAAGGTESGRIVLIR